MEAPKQPSLVVVKLWRFFGRMKVRGRVIVRLRVRLWGCQWVVKFSERGFEKVGLMHTENC